MLLTGFQARGTLGRFLDDGAKAVRIQGEEIKVAARIRRIDDYSGHADGPELARWIAARRPIRRGLFLIHGEDPAMAGLSGPDRRADHSRSEDLPAGSRRRLMISRHRRRPRSMWATAAGLRPRPLFRSIGTMICRSSSSTSTMRSNGPPMTEPAASSSAGCGGHSKTGLDKAGS